MGSAKLFHRRNLPQHQPVNRRAFLAKNQLESGRRQFDIKLGECKARIRFGDVLDFSKIVKVIGRNVNHTILLKCDMNGIQEIWCHEPVRMMTAFWPWVRKQEIECFHRSRRQKIANRIGTLYLQQPYVALINSLTLRAADSTV